MGNTENKCCQGSDYVCIKCYQYYTTFMIAICADIASTCFYYFCGDPISLHHCITNCKKWFYAITYLQNININKWIGY